MTLYEYLARTQTTKTQFAKDIDISQSALYKYINFERDPILEIAIKIHKASKGKIGYEDMVGSLQDADIEEDLDDLL
tara:strand:- start:2678 stop:2908 length:231 start_codon:yes stop_codon:yes gene_type:complete